MRAAFAFLLLAGAATAQDEKKVAALLLQASAEHEAAKTLWNKFVFGANDATDAELAEILAHYDKAIELCQKASESGDSGEADTMVVRLARRTAQLRATLFARLMRVRAEEAKKARPPPEAKPEEPKPPEPETPDGEPPEPPPAAEPAPPAAPELAALPELEESKEQRSRGIQSARDFLMNFYFSNRRRDALIDTCVRCNGRGIVRLPHIDPETQKPAKQNCGGCRATGYHFNEPVARKGFWLCWSPLHRMDGQEKAQWEHDVMTFKSDPRQIPEFLTSLRITKLDYHGLWAEVEWEEKGATAKGEKFTREMNRKLIRAGRQWFFYDPERDKEMFSGKPEAD